MHLLFPKKAKRFHWSGLENWPGLHRRQSLTQMGKGAEITRQVTQGICNQLGLFALKELSRGRNIRNPTVRTTALQRSSLAQPRRRMHCYDIKNDTLVIHKLGAKTQRIQEEKRGRFCRKLQLVTVDQRESSSQPEGRLRWEPGPAVQRVPLAGTRTRAPK